MNPKLKPMRTEVEYPPCVYCGKPAPYFAPLPKHVDCPRQSCREGVHVIAINQPVCADHNPEKEYMKREIEYEEEEGRREQKVEAKKFLLTAIADPLLILHSMAEIKIKAGERFSSASVDEALDEVREGNFELY